MLPASDRPALPAEQHPVILVVRPELAPLPVEILDVRLEEGQCERVIAEGICGAQLQRAWDDHTMLYAFNPLRSQGGRCGPCGPGSRIGRYKKPAEVEVLPRFSRLRSGPARSSARRPASKDENLPPLR
jgi:hypothetical protein